MPRRESATEPKSFPKFGELLNHHLGKQDRSAAWLAGRLGTNPSTVTRWISESRRPGQPEVVGRIADILGIHDPEEKAALFDAAGYLYRATPSTPSDEPSATPRPSPSESPAENKMADEAPSIPPETTNTTNFNNSVDGPIHTGSGNIYVNSGQADSTSPPFMVPPTPVHGVYGRNENLRILTDLLLLNDADATDVPPIALHGMGGIGKTTLATVLGRHNQIPQLFPDGVLWVSIGPKPTLRLLLDGWGKALGVDLLPERDEDACRDRLRNILHHRRVLLLVDDVWEVDHGRYFTVAGPRCRTLITTRETPAANELVTRERALQLDVLTMEDSLLLLESLAPEAVAANTKLCQQLCESVEFLPLALTLAGRFLANEADVPTRMTRLLGELVERREARLRLFQREQRPGIDEKEPSLQAILGLSVERLNDVDQDRFAMGSVFGGEPLTWDIDAAAFVWECSVEAAEETTARFIHRGLVSRRSEDGRYWMHALLADYAAEMMEEKGL